MEDEEGTVQCCGQHFLWGGVLGYVLATLNVTSQGHRLFALCWGGHHIVGASVVTETGCVVVPFSGDFGGVGPVMVATAVSALIAEA